MLLRVPRPDGSAVLIETRNIMLVEPVSVGSHGEGTRAVMASGPSFVSSWTLEGWLTAAAGLGKSIQDRRLHGDELARRHQPPRQKWTEK